MMRAMVLDHLREHGPATAVEIADATGRPLGDVRGALAVLAPPPAAKDMDGYGPPPVVALDAQVVPIEGDRLALTLPRPQPPAPPEPCSMRASGHHPAFMRAPGGALVCSACKQVQP